MRIIDKKRMVKVLNIINGKEMDAVKNIMKKTFVD